MKLIWVVLGLGLAQQTSADLFGILGDSSEGAKESSTEMLDGNKKGSGGLLEGIDKAAGGLLGGLQKAAGSLLGGSNNSSTGLLNGNKKSPGGLLEGIDKASGGLLSGIGKASADLIDGIGSHKNWEDGIASIIPIKDPLGDPFDLEEMARGLWENIKSARIKKKCTCGDNKICGCCLFLVIKNVTTSTACFNLTQIVGEKKLEISLVLNEVKLYTKNFGENDKCGNIPFTSTVAGVCLSVYNMTIDANGLHACVMLSIRLVSKEAVTFDFNCLLLSNKRLAIEKETGSPGTGLVHVNVPEAYNSIKSMRTLLRCALALCLLAIKEAELKPFEPDTDGWESDYAILEEYADLDESDEARGLMPKALKKLKTIEVQKKCECKLDDTCGCCVMLLMEQKEKQKICLTITELKDDKKVKVALLINEKEKYSKNIGEKDKCLKIPGTVGLADACISITNMEVNKSGLHGCLQIKFKFIKREALTIDFSCLILSKKKLRVEKANPNQKTSLIQINAHKAVNKLKSVFKKKD